MADPAAPIAPQAPGSAGRVQQVAAAAAKFAATPTAPPQAPPNAAQAQAAPPVPAQPVAPAPAPVAPAAPAAPKMPTLNEPIVTVDFDGKPVSFHDKGELATFVQKGMRAKQESEALGREREQITQYKSLAEEHLAFKAALEDPVKAKELLTALSGALAQRHGGQWQPSPAQPASEPDATTGDDSVALREVRQLRAELAAMKADQQTRATAEQARTTEGRIKESIGRYQVLQKGKAAEIAQELAEYRYRRQPNMDLDTLAAVIASDLKGAFGDIGASLVEKDAKAREMQSSGPGGIPPLNGNAEVSTPVRQVGKPLAGDILSTLMTRMRAAATP